MNRLTEKRKKPLITGNEEIIEYRLIRSYDSCINKLGQLEDLFEKYEINTIEQLEEILKENQKLKSNLTRWLELLETDGIDSKNMVATDIQHILEEINK